MKWVDPQFLPRFSIVLKTICQNWTEGFLWVHLVVSLWRVVMGLAMAALIGLPLGMALGLRGRRLVEICHPLFRLLSQANPFSLMPVFILLFGIGELAKLAVIAWVCLWPLLFNTVTGVQNTDSDWLKTARSMGLKGFALGVSVVFPAAAPAIFTGLRIGVEMSFFMLIAGEMIGASAGLGWLLHSSAHLYLIPRMYAAATCIVALGVVLNRLLLFLDQRLFFWGDNGLRSNEKNMSSKPQRRLGRYELALAVAITVGIIIGGGSLAGKVNQKGGIESNSRHFNHAASGEAPNFGSHGGL